MSALPRIRELMASSPGSYFDSMLESCMADPREVQSSKGRPAIVCLQCACRLETVEVAYGKDYVAEQIYAKGHDQSACLIHPLCRDGTEGLIDLWEKGRELDQPADVVYYPDVRRY